MEELGADVVGEGGGEEGEDGGVCEREVLERPVEAEYAEEAAYSLVLC